MDNFQNVVQFLKLINSDKGLHISARNITVSTCGLVDKIRELADLQLQITLAISLHAPNDELRKTMMPIANKYSIEQIMEACRYYLKQSCQRCQRHTGVRRTVVRTFTWHELPCESDSGQSD